MYWLNLRLPPAKKAWKIFTSKLQTKLHKLQNSKAITKKKKRKSKYSVMMKSPNPAPCKRRISLQSSRPVLPFFRFPQSNTTSSSTSASHFHFERKLRSSPSPVYVGKLFRKFNGLVVKNVKVVDEAGTSKEEEGKNEKSGGGDEMWESLGFGSPQMRGIDERAELFISSFRAEMELQEITARGL